MEILKSILDIIKKAFLPVIAYIAGKKSEQAKATKETLKKLRENIKIFNRNTDSKSAADKLRSKRKKF